MLESIAFLILIGSFVGMMMIFYRKIPILIEISKVPKTIHKEHFLTKLKENFKNRVLNFLPYEIFFQKILSKVRILILKIENKINSWIQNLRKRIQEKKNNGGKNKEDNYWKDIKNNLKK